ncbi:MAG: hypothetical protein L3J37_11895 [Rhodobacteraceae bacterium]|nr:hypothetical protein [Paracoccaceae bacterium]
MAVILNRDGLLREMKLDASVASADLYARFVRKIIKRSILPRKILIQSSKDDFEILAAKGVVARFRKLGAKSHTSVQYPLSKSGQRALEALEISAGNALEGGEISLSMVSDRERADLKKQDATVDTTSAAEPPEVVSVSDGKQDISKDSGAESPILADFFTGIQNKVKFVYLVDDPSGQVQISGASGVIDTDVAEALKPSILKWRKAVSDALGSGPQLITMRSPSGSGSSLCFAADGRQYLLAEIETKNFGVVAGLWIKASRAK